MSVSLVVIPARTDLPDYTLTVTLGSRDYVLRLYWNARDTSWYLDVADSLGIAIVAGLRVVLNWPIMRQVQDSRRPFGDIIAIDTTDTDTEPGLTDLGSRVLLTYAEPV